MPSNDSTHPPLQPTYILRPTHPSPAQIHSLHFSPVKTKNQKDLILYSGDANGTVVAWSLVTKRPLVSWQAHGEGSSVLGVWEVEGGGLFEGNGEATEREEGVRWIVSHGRDSKVVIWKWRPADELSGSRSFISDLPEDGAEGGGKDGWKGPADEGGPKAVRTIRVHSLNFCAVDICPIPSSADLDGNRKRKSGYLLASTSTQDGFVTVQRLTVSPDEGANAAEDDDLSLPSLIPTPKDTKVGMTMAIRILFLLQPHSSALGPLASRIIVLAGYESGHIALWHRPPSPQSSSISQHSARPTSLLAQSVSSRPTQSPAADLKPWTLFFLRKPHTQPVLSIDYSPPSPSISKGFFFSSAADGIISRFDIPSLDALLAGGKTPGGERVVGEMILQTRHSGQQGLVVRRGKGRVVFATAGWDARVRVYDGGGEGEDAVREVAVLKWHREGCYAVAWRETETVGEEGKEGEKDEEEIGEAVVKRQLGMTVKEKRVRQVLETHWLAAGSKDGKISLWDVY